MKSVYLFLIILFSVILFSCEIPGNYQVGFDVVFDQSSEGDTIMVVDDLTKILYLEGDITLTSGEVEVLVIKPDGSLAYRLLLDDPVSFISFSKEFESVEGSWTLKYRSIVGTGSLFLKFNN